MQRKSWFRNLRIVWAIAAKDTLDALKNLTLLTIIFGILGLMLSAKVLPLLLAARDIPTLTVYAPEGSAAIQTLAERDDMQIIEVNSQEELESTLIESQSLMIGLAIPPSSGLNSSSHEVNLEGYTPYWANPTKILLRVALFEEKLSLTSGQQVHINIEGHAIYPSLETGAHLMMAAQIASLMILLMGLFLVPYLFLEEKEQHTIDALRVSPARYGQIAAGKALAGSVYCLITAAVVLLFNFRVVIHWEIALLTVLLGSALAVTLGMLLGILVEDQASLSLSIGLVIIVLLVPPTLEMTLQANLPATIQSILPWTPALALYKLFKIAMSGEVAVSLIWQNVAILLVAALIVYMLVVWRLRRMDR